MEQRTIIIIIIVLIIAYFLISTPLSENVTEHHTIVGEVQPYHIVQGIEQGQLEAPPNWNDGNINVTTLDSSSDNSDVIPPNPNLVNETTLDSGIDNLDAPPIETGIEWSTPVPEDECGPNVNKRCGTGLCCSKDRKCGNTEFHCRVSTSSKWDGDFIPEQFDSFISNGSGENPKLIIERRILDECPFDKPDLCRLREHINLNMNNDIIKEKRNKFLCPFIQRSLQNLGESGLVQPAGEESINVTTKAFWDEYLKEVCYNRDF